MYDVFFVFVFIRRPQRSVFDELEAGDVHFIFVCADQKRIVFPSHIGDSDGESVVIHDVYGYLGVWSNTTYTNIQLLQTILKSKQLFSADFFGDFLRDGVFFQLFIELFQRFGGFRQ